MSLDKDIIKGLSDVSDKHNSDLILSSNFEGFHFCIVSLENNGDLEDSDESDLDGNISFLRELRAYFGEHDKTQFEHIAYNRIDLMIKNGGEKHNG